MSTYETAKEDFRCWIIIEANNIQAYDSHKFFEEDVEDLWINFISKCNKFYYNASKNIKSKMVNHFAEEIYSYTNKMEE